MKSETEVRARLEELKTTLLGASRHEAYFLIEQGLLLKWVLDEGEMLPNEI